MLGKRIDSMKKLAKMVKPSSNFDHNEVSHYECLLRESDDHDPHQERSSPSNKTPSGSFAVYVGDERQRFVVPMSYLSHPLFKMLLDKAYKEFGFGQRNGLVVPCSVNTFQEVLKCIAVSRGRFHFGDLVEEFIVK